MFVIDVRASTLDTVRCKNVIENVFRFPAQLLPSARVCFHWFVKYPSIAFKVFTWDTDNYAVGEIDNNCLLTVVLLLHEPIIR